MQNKYYTPTVEEFHIGFEYEFRTGDAWEPLIWRSDVTIMGRILKNLIRVKYLDKDDIESLGFKLRDQKDPYYLIFDKGIYSLMVYKNFYRYHMTIFGVVPYSEDHTDRIFFGEIKNKSELKRLLKQLGINE